MARRPVLLTSKDDDESTLHLDFEYSECLAFEDEVNECFSFGENDEVETWIKALEQDDPEGWKSSTPAQVEAHVSRLLDQIESAKADVRDAARHKLCAIALGHCRSLGSSREQQVEILRNNVRLVSAGVFVPIATWALAVNRERIETSHNGDESEAFASFRVNAAQRQLASVVALMLVSFQTLDSYLTHLESSPPVAPEGSEPAAVEALARADAQKRCEEELMIQHMGYDAAVLRVHVETFKELLRRPLFQGRSFTAQLFDLIVEFKDGQCPHLPVKKIVIILTKALLLSLGNFTTLKAQKDAARAKKGLAPAPRTVYPPMPAIALLSLPVTDAVSPALTGTLAKGGGEVKGGDTSGKSGCLARRFREKPVARPPPAKSSQADLQALQDASESRFNGYIDPKTKLFSTPPNVLDGMAAIKRSLYISLAEVQREEEKKLQERLLITHRRDPAATEARAGPVEDLYQAIFPNIQKISIGLLQLLLATTTANAGVSPKKAAFGKQNLRAETVHIRAELKGATSTVHSVYNAAQFSADEGRHREIVMRNVALLLVVLLKHLRLNHVLQFECFAKTLVEAKGIILLLKILNPDMHQLATAQNDLGPCLILSHLRFFRSKDSTTEKDVLEAMNTLCPRNCQSIINILRILQKLTKNKQARIVLLVLEKAAPIFKRCLRLLHPVLDVYAMKLLKSLVRYLGKGFRRNNMKLLSRIDLCVRHHFCDTWFYELRPSPKPTDFEGEETEVIEAVNRFNHYHYSTEEDDEDYRGTGVPDISSVDWSDIILPQAFYDDYEKFLGLV